MKKQLVRDTMAAANVVILHPDLGIGGAERLIVDLAIALKHHAHSVTMLTSHHDINHCFEETRNGSLEVICVGDWIPRSLFGKFYAACAYIRMIYVTFYLLFFYNSRYDLIVCDQISACIPFLKLFSPIKVLFYCHFPDQLLTRRDSFLKRLYRAPLDWIEEKSTGMADEILVNSNFTGEVFKSTFKSLTHVKPKILYPSQQALSFNDDDDDYEKSIASLEVPGVNIDRDQIKCLFLSINRYERKKNIALALRALGILIQNVSESHKKAIHLIIAGGYDSRVTENIEYHAELVKLADELQVKDYVSFVKSCSDTEKYTLLRLCTCLIYTPDKEHFGIVPIEAMQAGKPVIAVNSGGPKETVVDGKTGILCNPDEESFAAAMERFVNNKFLSKVMGTAAKEHVSNKFSFQAFSDNLNAIVSEMLNTDS